MGENIFFCIFSFISYNCVPISQAKGGEAACRNQYDHCGLQQKNAKTVYIGILQILYFFLFTVFI